MSRHRKLLASMLLALALIVAVRHPTADIRVLTHDAADPAPHRLQAAFDFGLAGISIVYTWTTRQIR